MSKKTIILIGLLSLVCLSSCFDVPKFSKGYQYDIELLPIEIAYHLDKDEFEYSEPVTVNISYGHSGVTDAVPNEKKNLPFCLFLDYGNKLSEDKSDYKKYNGYKLIEEVDSQDFWTDEYAYSQEGYRSKQFNYTTEFNIPFGYFEYNYSIKSINKGIKFIAGQMYIDENNKIHMFEMKSTEIELNFSFDSDKKLIKIKF